jgi:hypothetical protein
LSSGEKYFELGKSYFNDEYYNEYLGGNYLETKKYSCPSKDDIIFLAEWAGIEVKSAIDYGCALGTLVKDMNDAGIDCIGLEVSEYAVKNALSPKVFLDTFENANKHIKLPVDIIIGSYCIEHHTYEDLDRFLRWAAENSKASFFSIWFKNYISAEEEAFESISIKEPAQWWINKLSEYFEIVILERMIVCYSNFGEKIKNK